MAESTGDIQMDIAIALEEVMPFHDLTEAPDRLSITHDVIIIRRSQDEPPFTEYLGENEHG